MLQLDERTLELSQAVENLRNSRKANKAYFDQNNPLRPDGDQQLRVGDLVLLQNSQKFKSGKPSRAAKLDDRWSGPYRIREIPENSTFYYLDETDETPLAESYAGNRLKKFFSRGQLQQDRAEQNELQQTRQAATARRQARANNPARLQELLDMIDATRTSRDSDEGRNGDGPDDGEEGGEA